MLEERKLIYVALLTLFFSAKAEISLNSTVIQGYTFALNNNLFRNNGPNGNIAEIADDLHMIVDFVVKMDKSIDTSTLKVIYDHYGDVARNLFNELIIQLDTVTNDYGTETRGAISDVTQKAMKRMGNKIEESSNDLASNGLGGTIQSTINGVANLQKAITSTLYVAVGVSLKGIGLLIEKQKNALGGIISIKLFDILGIDGTTGLLLTVTKTLTSVVCLLASIGGPLLAFLFGTLANIAAILGSLGSAPGELPAQLTSALINTVGLLGQTLGTIGGSIINFSDDLNEIVVDLLATLLPAVMGSNGLLNVLAGSIESVSEVILTPVNSVVGGNGILSKPNIGSPLGEGKGNDGGATGGKITVGNGGKGTVVQPGSGNGRVI